MGSARYEGGTDHLTFTKQPLKKGAKLHKYLVTNSTFNENIGEIHWRGGWRQYVFTADLNANIMRRASFELNLNKEQEKKLMDILKDNNIDMSRSCHIKINEFIDDLMKE